MHKKLSHTNKARPHHLLCIVQTFLLELCFWILTVTVPVPGLNGNLVSGPFGFLIEYPWSSLFFFIDLLSLSFYLIPKQVHTFLITLSSHIFKSHAPTTFYPDGDI